MKLLTLIPLVLALSACTTRDNNKFCETPVRDLTEDWHSRTYWCLPKGYVPLIEPQVTVRPPTPSQVSSRVPFDATHANVIAPTTSKTESKPEVPVLYTEHESLQHKVRVVSQESVQAKPVATVEPNNTWTKSIEVMKDSVNDLEAGAKKVDALIGTEPVKKDTKKIKMQDINFTRHNLDTDLVSKELDWAVSMLKHIIKPERVLKLQGCRKDSEIESLVLGRALAVRKALVEKGVENKIIILTDQNCTTDRKVKVFMS